MRIAGSELRLKTEIDYRNDRLRSAAASHWVVRTNWLIVPSRYRCARNGQKLWWSILQGDFRDAAVFKNCAFQPDRLIPQVAEAVAR